MPSKVAVPVSEMGQAPPPGAVPFASADQVTVVPDNVPWAVPETGMVPIHFAVNVPEPLVPVTSVIVQWKSVQVLGSVVADEMDAHCPVMS